MRFKLTSRELQGLVDAEPAEFPKYATQIINLANQNAQETGPVLSGSRPN